MNLSRNICGVNFKNPIISASGTYGFGREFAQFYDSELLGGISLNALTLNSRPGNPNPRSAETDAGMINAVGLQNPGVEHFIENDLPWLVEQNTTIIANIAGNTIDEYVELAARLGDTSIDMIELNISCPNVKKGGMQFGIEPQSVAEITSKVKAACKQPLIVKLSPNVSDICANAIAAQDAGADALSLINTLTGMAVDISMRKPILANITGGLSGPAIKPIALRMVHQVCSCDLINIPVIGMGGIMTGKDVLEFMLCGADAVMVGTANLADPLAIPRILNELKNEMLEHKIDNLEDWVGRLLT